MEESCNAIVRLARFRRVKVKAGGAFDRNAFKATERKEFHMGARIRANAPRLRPYVRSGVLLEINKVARVDIELAAGGGSDAITVTSNASSVNTDNASIGRTLGAAEISALPIVNRNVYTLLELIPGVESSQTSIVLGYPEQRTMIDGGTDGGSGSVSYYLDGGNNMTGLRNTGNITPNPDAVAEFAVVTNSYSPEFGRFVGGVVNVITKSGSNELHGSLFEFLRNDKLNAGVWAPGADPAKAPLHRNQYGLSIGGPLKRNKTFFFGTWSGLRQITSTLLNSAVVPTMAERGGMFSQSKVIPIDPETNQPFPDTRIPLTRFDPTTRKARKKAIPRSRPKKIETPSRMWLKAVRAQFTYAEAPSKTTRRWSIPSLRMRYCRVVRLTPRRAAAPLRPLITPPLCCNTSTM